MAQIKLYEQDMTFQKKFEINQEKTILKQLLEQNAKIFHGCMGGSCGACACKIISNKENIDPQGYKKPTFTGLEPDEILVCCAKIKDKNNNQTIELKKKL